MYLYYRNQDSEYILLNFYDKKFYTVNLLRTTKEE